MTMKKIGILTGVFLIAFLSGCFQNNHSNKDSGKGVDVLRNQNKVEIKAISGFRGADFVVNKKIEEKDIKVNSNLLKIVKKDENSTKISVASLKGLIAGGEELFEIENCLDGIEVLMIENKTTEKSSLKREAGDILLGDFNINGKVDISDFIEFSTNYGGQNYNAKYDIAPAATGTGLWDGIYCKPNPDKIVNISDFIIFAANYGKAVSVEDILPSSITISGENSIDVGKTIILSAVVMPENATDKTVLWSSDNSAVAAVDSSGKITGITSGNAIIAAATKAGNKTATINITVKDASKYKMAYFRGTPNTFGKTEMKYTGNNIWEISSTFGTATDERFKVDVSGDWTEAYPAQDFLIKDRAGAYRITFNEITKEVKAFSKDEVVPSDISRNRLMVAIGYGQSISSNNAPTKYSCAKNVYNFDIYTNKFYKAKDPMRCADATGGSVWSRLGDTLIEKGMYDNVIMVTIGVNGTPISRWTKGGDLNPKLVTAIKAIKAAGFDVTHIFWHQGSSDADQYANTTKDQYKSKFYDMLTIIRENGAKAPIYVSIHTGNGDFNSNTQEIKNKRLAIQAAQRELVNGVDIFAGPDTDTYVPNSMRQSDGLHFNDAGYEKFRDMWIESITASKK